MTYEEKKNLVRSTINARRALYVMRNLGDDYLDSADQAFDEAEYLEDVGLDYIWLADLYACDYLALISECREQITDEEYAMLEKELWEE